MMKLRTVLFATLLLLTGAVTGAAQTGSMQCALKPAHAPQLRGLRLEMTLSPVKARYPKLPDEVADKLGQLRLHLLATRLAEIDPAAFKGIDQLSLYFIDNRLVSFTVNYPSLPWKNLNQFVMR